MRTELCEVCRINDGDSRQLVSVTRFKRGNQFAIPENVFDVLR